MSSSRDHAPSTSVATEKEPLPPGAEFRTFTTGSHCVTVSGEVREHDYLVGFVVTPDGVVGFYEQGRRTGFSPRTSLDVVVGGRCHGAAWRRLFSGRFLKTLAKRFAASVAREHSSPRQVVQPIREDR